MVSEDVYYVPNETFFPTDSEIADDVLFRMGFATGGRTPLDAQTFFGSVEEKAIRRRFPAFYRGGVEADWLEDVWSATGHVDEGATLDLIHCIVICCIVIWLNVGWESTGFGATGWGRG